MVAGARVAFVLMALALAFGARSAAREQRFTGEAMGTTWSATVVAGEARVPALRDAIERELARLVAQMSTWESGSELTRFNAAPPGTWHVLSEDTFIVVAHALALARDTGGAYDPTVGPLVAAWGFGPSGRVRDEPPTPAAIATARARVGFARITLDANERRALQPGDIAIDVSSLGPGYAVDRMAAVLRAAGVDAFLVELGGELRAAGRKPDGGDWHVAVERPDAEALESPDLVVALRDFAAASSGDYRAGFEHDGRRYSHTIDPRTGEPVTHALAAVTVLAPDAMQADALAAALMVLGPDAGWAYARDHDVAAAFLVRDKQGHERRLTPAFSEHVVQ